MLVLSRKTRDAIVIGHEVRVMVLSIGRDQVRLGIEAPPDVEVHREEVYLAIQEANRQAAASSAEGSERLAAVLPERNGSADQAAEPVSEATKGTATP
jgi:carbon storage regulator